MPKLDGSGPMGQGPRTGRNSRGKSRLKGSAKVKEGAGTGFPPD